MNLTRKAYLRIMKWILISMMTTGALLPLAVYSKTQGEAAPKLIETHDFKQLSKQMQEKNLPLLLEFHAIECPYCRQLEEEFLTPMLLSGEYKEQTLIRQLQLDLMGDIIDFNGKTISVTEFANRYHVAMTPTMIFLNADGIEVAEKIIGINTPSLFGGYIDSEIEKALTKVRAKDSLAKRELPEKD